VNIESSNKPKRRISSLPNKVSISDPEIRVSTGKEPRIIDVVIEPRIIDVVIESVFD
jgi:hypothetical protein